jgi:hypothetical protein
MKVLSIQKIGIIIIIIILTNVHVATIGDEYKAPTQHFSQKPYIFPKDCHYMIWFLILLMLRNIA